MGAELICVDGQMDKHEKDNRHFLQETNVPGNPTELPIQLVMCILSLKVKQSGMRLNTRHHLLVRLQMSGTLPRLHDVYKNNF